MPRFDDPYIGGYPMSPRWDEGDPLDPNWSRGRYHGMRMGRRPGQAAYGMHRVDRAGDLPGHGGVEGIYDEGPGRFDAEGVFHHPRLEGRGRKTRRALSPPAGREPRRVEDGGVRGTAAYLRQYNAASPMLREGWEEARGFGWAPDGEADGVRRRRAP